MLNKPFLSTKELAAMLGISRVAVFQRIKKGAIKATKVGKTYVIDPAEVESIVGTTLTGPQKDEVDRAVKKTVKEYGETLRLLGRE